MLASFYLKWQMTVFAGDPQVVVSKTLSNDVDLVLTCKRDWVQKYPEENKYNALPLPCWALPCT